VFTMGTGYWDILVNDGYGTAVGQQFNGGDLHHGYALYVCIDSSEIGGW
jgi:hypothetical protein